MEKLNRELDYNPEQAELIGILVTYFQRLEYVISSLCWKLIDEDDMVGKQITTALGFRRLCDLIINLYKYKIKDHKTKIIEFNNLIKEALTLEQQRDIIIHSQFIITSSDYTYTVRAKRTIKFERGFKENFEKFPNVKIKEINIKIKKLIKKLSDFIPYTNNEMMNVMAKN